MSCSRVFFFFSSRRRHTRLQGDWSSDACSSDLELTRAELRELTGLSKPTIAEAVRRLTDAGLVVVVGHVSAGPGPNAEVYAANPSAAYVIAVSVRDTFLGERTSSPSLAAAVCDVSGTVRGRLDAPIDFERDDPVEAVGAMGDQARPGGDGSRIGGVQVRVPRG